jgi:hypothetical protein
MTKTYFDMGRRSTDVPIFTDKYFTKTEVHVDPALPYFGRSCLSATAIETILAAQKEKMDKTISEMAGNIYAEFSKVSEEYLYGAGNQAKPDKIYTGTGPIIDIDPEDYRVVEETKLIKG